MEVDAVMEERPLFRFSTIRSFRGLELIYIKFNKILLGVRIVAPTIIRKAAKRVAVITGGLSKRLMLRPSFALDCHCRLVTTHCDSGFLVLIDWQAQVFREARAQYRPPGPILIGLPASRQERWPRTLARANVP